VIKLGHLPKMNLFFDRLLLDLMFHILEMVKHSNSLKSLSKKLMDCLKKKKKDFTIYLDVFVYAMMSHKLKKSNILMLK
jgi:hypothetical protein